MPKAGEGSRPSSPPAESRSALGGRRAADSMTMACDGLPRSSPLPAPLVEEWGSVLGNRRAADLRTPAGRRRVPRVNFSHVSIRSHQLELWGGGGVPGDGGAPLGLGWTVMNERRVPIDEFEKSRAGARRPKEVCTLADQASPYLARHSATRSPRQTLDYV